jgi:hypothetical protein
MAEVDKNAVRWCVVAAIRDGGGQKPPAHDPIRIDKYLNETTIEDMLGDVGENVAWGRSEVVKNTDQRLHDEGITSGPTPAQIANTEWLGEKHKSDSVMTYADAVYDAVTKPAVANPQEEHGGGNG